MVGTTLPVLKNPFQTAGGIHEVEEIGKLLFTYIGMLQKVGVKEWILDAWFSTWISDDQWEDDERVFHAPFLCLFPSFF